MKERHKSQHTAGRPTLGVRSRVWMALAAPVCRLLLRLLIRTWRIDDAAVADALARPDTLTAPPLPCCWHRELAPATAVLLARRAHNPRPGFLVSPSRDGEFVARIVGGLGAAILRGSANRTGARALRELYRATQAGVAPILHPDGPRGPPLQAKSGGARLAQMTGAPLLPLAFTVDRGWRLATWDGLIVPKPFARITVAAGPALAVAAGDDADAAAAELTARLNALAGAGPGRRP